VRADPRPDWMSPESFEQNTSAVVAQVRALVANPKSRKRFRIMTLYESNTNELLAEVFPTTYGLVVYHRERGRVSRARNSATHRHDDSWIAPLTGDPEERFRIAVPRSAAEIEITGADIARWLAAPKARHAISWLDHLRQPRDPPGEFAQLAKWLADNVDLIAAHPKAGQFCREIDQLFDDVVRALSRE
jgi:plasmid stabilization system protein ParE